jgi:translation initiation factor 2B subunit (eIF-2B alpha/beta/delta family)
MATGPTRVVAVVRHREAVLACRSADESASLSLPNRSLGGEAPEAAVRSLLDELGIDSAALERRGEPVAELIPFLVSVPNRAVSDTDRCPDPGWTPPAELGARTEAPLRAYERVAPTVETVATDTERGSTAIATDALWALRDAATRARADGDGLARVGSVASELLEARPSMAALANRVNRAMTGAETPADVERAASEGIVRAAEADEEAAALAAETVAGSRVLTLSRSGTVGTALLEARPEVVLLASRPGGEGLDVADELVDAGLNVSTCPDADVYEQLRSGAIDVVLVGADAVTPDGGVVNKVGTRAAALAAERPGIPFYAVCASDKVRPSSKDDDGYEPLTLEPMFDLTPPRLVTSLLTERGRLTPVDVRSIAHEHRALTAWRD